MGAACGFGPSYREDNEADTSSTGSPSSSQALAPTQWVAPSVHTCNDNDGVRIDAIEQGVRKALDQKAPRIAEDERLAKRISRDVAQPEIHRFEKLFASRPRRCRSYQENASSTSAAAAGR